MRSIDDTHMGMLKAFHFRLARRNNPPPPKRKHTYETAGTVVHASRRLLPAERSKVAGLVAQLAVLDPHTDGDQIKDILKQLGAQPVKFVPVKRETPISTSKTYPYRSKKRGG